MSLVKIAANAFTKRFASGALSSEGLKTIQNAGMVRSGERILSGFNQGTENMLKAKGVKVNTTGFGNKLTAFAGGGYAASPGNVYHLGDSKLKYFTPFHSMFTPTKNKAAHAIGFRHEAHEISEIGKGNRADIHLPLTNKARKSYIKALDSLEKRKGFFGKLLNMDNGISKFFKKNMQENIPQLLNQDIGKVVGAHNNLAVLGKESNDVRTLKSLYKIDTSGMEGPRHSITHEPKLLERLTGKVYGKDAYSKADLKKLRTAKHDFKIKSDGFTMSSGYISR